MTAGMVIVGAGECGVAAALALRAARYAGPVTLIGEEGDLPYERPPLSKGGAGTPGEAVTLKPIRPEAAYAEAGIELLRGLGVTAIDRAARTVTLSDGRALPYHRLLLATGAEARRLPGASGVDYLRRAADARAILPRLGPGRHLVVIGAGFIGLELAATARRMGAEVTVLEMAPRILGRAVLPEIAAVIAERHRAEGVRILTGVGGLACRDGIVIHDGGRIGADLVVAGIGAVPRTDLAVAAGLATDSGITVDARLFTTDPAILAAGDCCAVPFGGRMVRLESWRNAQDQGAHAAASMLGAGADFARLPWLWSDQYDLGLQVMGLPDPAAPAIRRDLGDGAFILFQQDGAGRIISASGIGSGQTVARDIRLAEMLAETGTPVSAEALADAGQSLKRLLRVA